MIMEVLILIIRPAFTWIFALIDPIIAFGNPISCPTPLIFLPILFILRAFCTIIYIIEDCP